MLSCSLSSPASYCTAACTGALYCTVEIWHVLALLLVLMATTVHVPDLLTVMTISAPARTVRTTTGHAGVPGTAGQEAVVAVHGAALASLRLPAAC